MLHRIVVFAVLSTFFVYNQYAQCSKECPSGRENGVCWGDDPGTAKEKQVLYSDFLKAKKYSEALEPLEWLLANTPNLRKALYINGNKIYKALLKAEQDRDKKKVHQNKILDLYDKRICYFGEEAKVLGMKGQVALRYLMPQAKTDRAVYDTLQLLYKRIFDLNRGKKMFSANLQYYMQVASIRYQLKKITEDEYLDIFDEISEELEMKIQNAKDNKNRKYWINCEEQIEQRLIKTVKIDCKFIKEKWSEDIENDDLKRSKQALYFMTKDTCTDEPLYLKAATRVFEHHKTPQLASIITKKYLKNENYETAYLWYEKVLESLPLEEQKERFETYMSMARLKAKEGQRSKARQLAQQAIEVDETLAAQAYEFIGDLYFGSAKLCRGGNAVEDRYVYLAAYEMYLRAGNSQKQKRAKAQFPSITDIFTQGMQEQQGQSIQVGCWINTSATLRGRSTK